MALADGLDALLFCDQPAEYRPRLEGLYLRAKSSVLLSKFLQDSIDGVNAASYTLTELSPTAKAALFARDFLQLIDVQNVLNLPRAAKSMVLSCVMQLGSLILCAEANPYVLGSSSTVTACGIGAGMLPAVAASLAANVVELLKLSPKFVLLSLRLGLAVSHRAHAIEEAAGSWCLSLSNISSRNLWTTLEKFHETNCLPNHRHVYVAAITGDGFTVSGPPSSLDLLLSQSLRDLESASPVRSPLSGPLHAPHLPLPDLEDILGELKTLDIPLKSKVRVISTSSGNIIEGHHDVWALLWKCLVDILQLPSDLVAVCSQLQALAHGQGFHVMSFGSSTFATYLQHSIPSLRLHEDPLITGSYLEHRELDNPIAIVGMSGRFPGADSTDELWQLLLQGLDTHKEVPPDRFDVRTHCDASGGKRNTTLTPYGCFIERPDLFDTCLFKMSAREAAQTDPMQRLMLMTAYEALETAGYSSEDTINHIFGTYYGQSSDDWREVNAGQDIDIFHITGGNRAFGPGRINYFFGWEGPSMNIDAACSASALSIQLACSALKSRECDTALAGGANILTASDIFAGLSRGGFLSPTGPCKTWDAEADGYCRADAVGTVVLKRMDDSIRNRDNVLAVVRSAATNHSAKAVSITHPHSDTQRKLFESVLQQAHVSPEDVDYVEMHGTGTQAGDIAESASIASVFAKPRKDPLYVGTVKANIGHGEAASGVTSVIKAIMMIREGMIPRHVGIKGKINPRLAFNGLENIRIPLENVPFPSKIRDLRRILINNFNATGGNTSLLLEEGPAREKEGEDPRRFHVIAFSAARPSSLMGTIQRMIEHLFSSTNVALSDLAYTTTSRRIHHKVRVAYAVENTSQLVQQLQSTSVAAFSPKIAPAVIFLFTGQSTTLPGAATFLFRHSAAFRRRLESVDAMCQNFGLPSVVGFLTDPNYRMAMQDPRHVQIALVALEIALAEQWKTWGLRPTMVIGHSLGEYAALYVAGVLSMADALYLVGVRAKLLWSKLNTGSGGMMVVKLSVERIMEVLQICALSTCEIAAVNTPTTTVVSGPKSDLERLEKHLSSHEAGTKTVSLKIPYAFHSAQMDDILDEFEVAAQGVRFGKPVVPVISTLLGSTITEEGIFDAAYLVRQMREPVRFVDTLYACLEYLKGESPIWLEISPSPVCIPMVRSTLRIPSERLLSSLDSKENDWKIISKSLAKAYQVGIDIRWREYHGEHEAALHLLPLPTYSFDLKSHWLQYEGDWCITKNQMCSDSTNTNFPSLHSTTVHHCEGQKAVEGGTEFAFITDFASPMLKQIAMGHLVNGSALCPSSIYTDMAMTVATYCWKHLRPTEDCPAIDVASMEVFKPLIIRSDAASQPVRTVAKDCKDQNQVKISIESVDAAGDGQHARCVVNYSQLTDWTSDWENIAYLYQSRIDHLVDAAGRGKAHRMLKGIVYELFSNFVNYDGSFQMIEEVILDSDMKEATACVSLRPTKGDFFYDPRWIDALAHLSGFILNGNDQAPDDVVYVSHGWKNMRFAVTLVSGHTYRTYIRMQPVGNRGFFAGDLHIFDGENIVGVIAGLKFQAIKKSVLATLLSIQPGAAEATGRPLEVHQGSFVVDHSRGPSSTTTTQKTPTTSATSTNSSRSGDLTDIFRSVLAQEMGIHQSEIDPNAVLVDLGVDSLLSLAIISAFGAQTSVQLPLGFFHDHSTLAHARVFLEALSSPEPTPAASPPQQQEVQLQCTFVHLQRTSKSGAPSLFLFPDGSGSASSYVNLGSLSIDSAVIAFNSPFYQNPKDFTMSLENVANLYVSSISSLDPQGPVFLGGWSIGGVYAYEVARQMLSSGREIAGLIMIDAISPQSMPPLPVETVDILEAAGIYDSFKEHTAAKRLSTVHEDVQQHFRASIRALEAYSRMPLRGIAQEIKRVACGAIWAQHGVFEFISQEKMHAVQKSYRDEVEHFNSMQEWLLVSKRDFGPHGWEELVGCRVECEVVDGHHFSIMRPPAVRSLNEAIDKALRAMLAGL